MTPPPLGRAAITLLLSAACTGCQWAGFGFRADGPARRHGAPPIEVRVSKSKSTRIEVCDGGTGVPEADRERIFEPFYRRPGAADGAGLGLALVRQIARRHGGEARCEGNCFYVTLPGG